MLRTKIITMVLTGCIVIGMGTTVFASQVPEGAKNTSYPLEGQQRTTNSSYSLEGKKEFEKGEKLENLSAMLLEYNMDLYNEYQNLITEHQAYHAEAKDFKSSNQADRRSEFSAIRESLKAGEITREEATTALNDLKSSNEETQAQMQILQENKEAEDNANKAQSRATIKELKAELSSETADVAVINELLAELVALYDAHIEIDYKYQEQFNNILS